MIARQPRLNRDLTEANKLNVMHINLESWFRGNKIGIVRTPSDLKDLARILNCYAGVFRSTNRSNTEQLKVLITSNRGSPKCDEVHDIKDNFNSMDFRTESSRVLFDQVLPFGPV